MKKTRVYNYNQYQNNDTNNIQASRNIKKEKRRQGDGRKIETLRNKHIRTKCEKENSRENETKKII